MKAVSSYVLTDSSPLSESNPSGAYGNVTIFQYSMSINNIEHNNLPDISPPVKGEGKSGEGSCRSLTFQLLKAHLFFGTTLNGYVPPADIIIPQE